MAVVLQLSDGRVLQIAGESATVGRDANNEVAFPSYPALELRHARIHRVGSRWYVEATGAHTLFVNSQSGRTFQLSAGDSVQLSERGPGFVFQPSQVSPPPVVPSAPVVPPNSDRVPPNASPTLTSSVPLLAWVGAGSVALILVLIGAGLLIVGLRGPNESSDPDTAQVTERRSEPVAEAPPVASPEPEQPDTPTITPVDPEEFLVLTGLQKRGADTAPLIMGIGWLWDESHVVTPEVTALGLKGLAEQSAGTENKYDLCVVQGLPIGVRDVQVVPQTGLAIMQLAEPAITAGGVASQCSSMSFRSVNLALERKEEFRYASFRMLPRSEGLGERQTPAFGYHPNHIHRDTVSVSILQERRSASFTQAPDSSVLEAGGLLLNEDDQIIGVSLLDRSVVWSDECCDRIAAAVRQGQGLSRRGTR